ncbi:GH92 family glycosyl hydrolase [Photobacterium lutimaris]|uniref:Glycoside hydrolase family 92 protein n=1 Tax=Photobacterium lutimaris TaxID=388278 RepID=A0A2T3IK77_9GAMM|nr:GH92 family glycosyl hydrolase [Photobacterium lutimaris]PSU28724.1 glycoside hydrolase family 92 protein [Photobacterium lutimaris]TDR70253.1 putative alpha-1,2-mannosidase [Photobacterium lutimaris]
MLSRVLSLSLPVLFAMSGCHSDSSNDTDGKQPIPTPDLTVLKYVDTLIGTDGLGNVNPSPVMPEGMIQPSPDNWNPNSWDGKGSPSDYHHHLDQLSGFSTTHISGAGKGDLNDFAFLPYTGFNTNPVTMDKAHEVAEVGYYSVDLIETGIKAELTATDRVAFHRYNFKEGVSRKVRVDLQHELLEQYGNHSRSIYYRKVADNAIAGARTSNEWAQWQTVYFYAEFSEPFIEHSLFVEGRETSRTEVGLENYAGYGETRTPVRDVKTHLNFGEGSAPITVKIAISGTGIDGAIKNLDADNNGWDFDAVVLQSKEEWARVLGQYTVTGASEADKTMYYTSLYRTYIAPFVYQDVDGHYRGMDGKIYQNDGSFTNMSVYSMWDTFRTAHPLKTIVDKKQAINYARDLLNKAKTGGVLPKWELHSDYTGEMVGYPAVSVIADVMVKYPEAFTQDEFKAALAAADIAANFDEQIAIDAGWVPYRDPWNGDKRFTVMTRHGQYAEQYGFVPANVKWDQTAAPSGIDGLKQDKYDELVNESVSYGLENAYYDWCIAQIAKMAGNQAQYERYMARSSAYQQYFDYDPAEYSKYGGATGFMRPIYLQGGVAEFANNLDASCVDQTTGELIEASDFDACKDLNKATMFWPYRAEHRGENYTEGNTWQWTWFVPHDIDGLKKAMGGEPDAKAVSAHAETSFLANLNALFTAAPNADTSQGDMTGYIGQFIMGNEPDHHVPYLYNWTTEPWKTQEYVHQAVTRFFQPIKDGLIGNEDVGQMSAWYVMAALGFYQVTPADPTYTIGRPIFDIATIPVEGGQFTIIAENNSVDNIYVQSATINGQPLTDAFFFQHHDIKPGGELRFVMTGNKEEALKPSH